MAVTAAVSLGDCASGRYTTVRLAARQPPTRPAAGTPAAQSPESAEPTPHRPPPAPPPPPPPPPPTNTQGHISTPTPSPARPSQHAPASAARARARPFDRRGTLSGPRPRNTTAGTASPSAPRPGPCTRPRTGR